MSAVWRIKGHCPSLGLWLAAAAILLGAPMAKADFSDGWMAVHQGDYPSAVTQWRELGQAGHVDVQFNLGVLYESGLLGEPDYEEAATWYGYAAARGLPAAQQRLGDFYARGLGFDQDLSKAFELYQSAAEAGYGPGQFSLAVALEKGAGVPVDNDLASLWYHRAASQGMAAAQYNLGRTFVSGGSGNDPEQALFWYRQAANGGLAEAQNNLGLMYERGIGVDQDYEQAVHWYSMAAEQGFATAQNNLGVMYHFGRGVPHDPGRAAAAYHAAAVGGSEAGQINLAYALANGIGLEQDIIEAYAWVLIARSGDETEAAATASEYRRRLLGVLTEDLRRAGLERATILRETLEVRPAQQTRRLVPIASDLMGNDVAAVQRYLREHNRLDGPVDGVDGPNTRRAIRTFQEEYGLPVTGILDQNLIDAMARLLPMPWNSTLSNTDRRNL